MTPDPSAAAARVRHVEVEQPVHVVGGTSWRGVVVLNPGSASGRLEVRALTSDAPAATPASWDLASPRMQRRFPRAPNAASARFEVVVAAPSGPVVLELDGDPVARAGEQRAAIGLDELRARWEATRTGEHGEDFASLYAALGAVPLIERVGCDWLRLSVLVLVSFRERHRAALEQLALLRDLLDPADFDSLWAQVEQLLEPLALTLSGYHPALASRDPVELWRELGELVERLEGLGCAVFLNSGTLLGAVRAGRPLGHDYDVDLGVVLEASDAESVVEAFWDLKAQLRGAGLLSEAYDTLGRHHARVDLPSGLPVDLFPAWVSDGLLSVWPYAREELSGSALLPLRHEQVGGTALPLPQDPEAILAVNYGPGWRTFDPTFTFDWATARERHRDLIAASLRRWAAEPSARG